MSIRWQSLILIALILISLTLTQFNDNTPQTISAPSEKKVTVSRVPESNVLAFQGGVFDPPTVNKIPARKWNVLDPRITAEAALVHLLDDDIPLFYYNTHDIRPLASLTKLLTAVYVIEDIGKNIKIPISKEATDTEGRAGNLESGEVYTAIDLIKIMLLTSSNDAAAAFEEYSGGKATFAELLNKKAKAIGLSATLVYDGSGLSDLNSGTARDMLTLTRYILQRHPEIFNWTRIQEFLVQPINDVKSKTLYNINNLVKEREFLGGKTGTSEAAKQNLVAIFSYNNYRIVVILLGSQDRETEAVQLLDWIKRAYEI